MFDVKVYVSTTTLAALRKYHQGSQQLYYVLVLNAIMKTDEDENICQEFISACPTPTHAVTSLIL